jgi:hypothetical protein
MRTLRGWIVMSWIMLPGAMFGGSLLGRGQTPLYSIHCITSADREGGMTLTLIRSEPAHRSRSPGGRPLR